MTWPILRLVAWTKRLAQAAESLAYSQHELLLLERQRMRLDHPPARAPRRAEIYAPTVEDFNKAYREAHPEVRLAEEDEEVTN